MKFFTFFAISSFTIDKNTSSISYWMQNFVTFHFISKQKNNNTRSLVF